MTEEDIKHHSNNTYRFCEKQVIVHKVRDHCHLTGKYRGPAHQKYKRNVTQKQSIFIPFVFHNFSNYDCHLFLQVS